MASGQADREWWRLARNLAASLWPLHRKDRITLASKVCSRPVVSIGKLAGHPAEQPAKPCGAGRHNEELDVDLERLDAMRNDIADEDIECIQNINMYTPPRAYMAGMFDDTMDDYERKKAEIWADAFKAVMIELIEEWGLGR